MNAREALKYLEHSSLLSAPTALATLEECVTALEILVAYVENRQGHAKPYAPAMGRARNALKGARC